MRFYSGDRKVKTPLMTFFGTLSLTLKKPASKLFSDHVLVVAQGGCRPFSLGGAWCVLVLDQSSMGEVLELAFAPKSNFCFCFGSVNGEFAQILSQ